MMGSELDSLLEAGSVTEILNDLMLELGVYGKIACIIGIVIGLVGCFLGFKLTKLYIALCGFALGGGIGIALALYKDQPAFLAVGLVLAIVLAILGYKLYKFGVFIVSALNGWIFTFLISLLITKDENPALVIACIGALIIAVLCVIFVKPALILSTAIPYGTQAGIFLALLLNNTVLAVPFGIVLAVLGIIVQIKTNNGFLETPTQNPNEPPTLPMNS